METRHNAACMREQLMVKSKTHHESSLPLLQPFSITNVPYSTTLHLDYTGPLPDVCTSGTRYFQVSCWGGYINIVPLTSLRGLHTAPALKQAVEFFREKGIKLDTLRMENQHSPPLAQMARTLELTLGLVPPNVHNPNWAERAFRTAKNHIIATRAGFHADCQHTNLDKCVVQIVRI